mmetsp:Transcript_494/g.1538  ORF Transcript_494/g.1538 Transcript_494/m.1538 type:complete len:475 (-) Transcript_494:211-1635(-)
MVFFRLGKIERTAKDEKEKTEASSDRKAEAESSSSGAAAAASTSTGAAQEREKEKPEKSKKKAKDEGGGSGGGAAATSGEGRSGNSVPPRAQAGLSVNDFISKTKNQQRQGLKPSGPELIAYARYLGIDPVADHDLLWIAVEALEAPLPSDWTEHFDSNDRVFYYNATMRVSSWTHPLEHIYRETYKTIVNFRNANMAPQERNERLHQLQHEVKQMEHDVHKEIAQWTEHTDEQGNRFYFNREERQSTWTDPRPAKCQILYLRMKMLRLLQPNTGGASGFAPLSSVDFDDPAMKRPKVGGSSRPVDSGHWPDSQRSAAGSWSDAEVLTDGPQGRNSPISRSSSRNSESESDDDRKGKKKKKKKKKKKRDQNLRNSQSEPTVGGKQLLLSSVDDVRGGGGLGGLQNSPSGPNALALGPFDHGGEGLSNVGRARVKAGIRLEPISAVAPPDRPGDPSPDRLAKGVRNSASVPSLQP